jgi:hypothetical protein
MLPPFKVQLIVQLGAAVSEFPQGRAVFDYESVCSLHFKHLSGFNVFLKVYYI